MRQSFIVSKSEHIVLKLLIYPNMIKICKTFEFVNISLCNNRYCPQSMNSDDTCSKPLLRGYVGYSVNASSVYLDYAAENVPYGTLFEDRPNHWRPEPNLAMATFRVSV